MANKTPNRSTPLIEGTSKGNIRRFSNSERPPPAPTTQKPPES